VRGAAVVVAILVGFGALFAAFAWGPFAWAGELWRQVAPDWPGEGYGFAATAGAVLPVALVAMMLGCGGRARTGVDAEYLRCSSPSRPSLAEPRP
jgi:hypothetical protein